VTVLDLLLQIALSVALTSAVLRWDSRRLSSERYARSWNSASFWSAVVAFGPLCIPVHFARTRRTVVGLGLGLVVMIVTLVVLSLMAAGVEWVGDAVSGSS
jgi:hypothetical protein